MVRIYVMRGIFAINFRAGSTAWRRCLVAAERCVGSGTAAII